jgi:hypothetical protein
MRSGASFFLLDLDFIDGRRLGFLEWGRRVDCRLALLVGSVFDRVTTSLRHWLRAEHQPGIAGRFFIRLGATQAARVTSRVTGRTEVRATTAKIVSSSTKYRVG